MLWRAKMFGILKKKPELEKPKAAEEQKPEVVEKPQAAEKPSKKAKRARKPAEAPENTGPQKPQAHADVKAPEKPFVGIKEYNSVSEIVESIDKEIAGTKSALGEYLRQLDDRRVIAEKSQRIHDVVTKLANKKETKENPNQVDVNGLEIVLEATALAELAAIESVVQSQQKRLITLQKVREALKTLDQVSDTEGIRYLALEKEGIPEQILLKLS
jgi:hypothetical protein